MLLSEYMREITETVGELTKTGLILSSGLTADFRTKKIGLIKGTLSFSDDSKFFSKNTLICVIKSTKRLILSIIRIGTAV